MCAYEIMARPLRKLRHSMYSRTMALSSANKLLLSFLLFVCMCVLYAYKSTQIRHFVRPTNVYFGVKTSASNHGTRLNFLLNTWIPTMAENVYIFTDGPLTVKSAHVHQVSCPDKKLDRHYKLNAEIMNCQNAPDHVWWCCHADDDLFYNLDQLFRKLTAFDRSKKIIVGKPAVAKMADGRTFLYARGGAGFCMTRSVANLLKSEDYLYKHGTLQLFDDETFGYILLHKYGVPVTPIPEFHSHHENLRALNAATLRTQLTISYKDDNVIHIDGFPLNEDPTRFYSYMCLLKPKKCSNVLPGKR